MRKILYSPGFGAGWTSWHRGNADEEQFMLEHPGLIAAVESGESTDENSPAIAAFARDFRAKFPGRDLPYLGGAGQLRVEEVSGRVRINEYDGSESVEVEGAYEGWR